MTSIRDIFDPAKQIDRRIEKVITIDMEDEDLLKQEVREYVATDSIAESFERLLEAVDEGMSTDGIHEVGVWVSGFYGSGKSSFIKYLGFALDPDRKLDGEPFLKRLQDQFTSQPLRQRLSTVAKKHSAAVIMIDLASQSFAGAGQESISNVLYYKVMQWAGYSKDRKFAYLQNMLERDGKLDDFKRRAEEEAGGKSWDEIKNQPLVTKTIASKLAAEFYPEVWPDAKAFNEVKIDEVWPEDERVQEMLDIVRRKSGRDKILFILDEVGQYIASRDDLILNLDGLAKNIKNIGRGKAWLIATAQQTLTEDDPGAVLNTPKLFKLQDRFPITIDLKASDIREICYRRLLGKSPEGEKETAELFDRWGAQLRNAVELKNTRYYSKDLDKKTFCRLYPFLPQHFDILLELLGRLARTRGGVGLRSAIKVVQDVLVDQSNLRSGAKLLADSEVGALANAPVFYDTLERDIERSFPHITEGVRKAETIFGRDSDEHLSAKTVGVLQILEDFPTTKENIAALMHPSVSSPSLQERVDAAVDNMLSEPSVPLNELDGKYRFVSEAVGDLEREKTDIFPQTRDRQSLFNSTLREVLTPAPSARLKGTRNVTSGIKVFSGKTSVSVSGDREEIQTHVLFAPESGYDQAREDIIQDSVLNANRNNVYLLAKEDSEFEDLIVEIHRCQTIFGKYKNKSGEKEVEEYLRSQNQRAESLKGDLERKLKAAMLEGALIFRGQAKAVSLYGDELSAALNKMMSETAEKVFGHFDQAPLAGDSTLAERFLKAKLDHISSKDDPLELVRKKGGNVGINADHPALLSIKDYLERAGHAEGRRLLDDFYRAPYGWSKDITRYLVAAMLVGGVVKLRFNNEDIKVRGETAVSALKNTNSFNKAGVSLRDTGPKPDALLKAAQRLLDLAAEQVLPIEEEISKTVIRFFPDFQQRYASLPVLLQSLELPGVERAEGVQEELAEILKGDASEAALRLGGDECPLCDDLVWAAEVKKAFDNGIGDTIKKARGLLQDIPSFPAVGAVANMISRTEDHRETLRGLLLREDFHALQTDMGHGIADIEQIVKETCAAFKEESELELAAEKETIQSSPEWSELVEDDRVRLSNELDQLEVSTAEDLNGLKRLMNERQVNLSKIAVIREEVKKLIEAQRKDDKIYTKDLSRTPRIVTSESQLDTIISELADLKSELGSYEKIILKWE